MDNAPCFDVIIVGAGPAGSTTATYAARGGLKVLLLDKREHIGIPVRCGEYLLTYHPLRDPRMCSRCAT